MEKQIEGYVTIFELAELTRFKVATLRKYVLTRRIPFHKINRAVRFKPSEIEIWMRSGGRAAGILPADEGAGPDLAGKDGKPETGGSDGGAAALPPEVKT